MTDQRHLTGGQATVDRVRAAIRQGGRDLRPDGLLVLTFTGHSDRRRRDGTGEALVRWCLHDGDIRPGEVRGLLGAVAPTARVVVIADTCYAGAFATRADVPYTLVLLAACAENQTTISGPTSEFVVRLERLICPDEVPNPLQISYRWLEAELQRDTPDAERPQVWTNRQEAWRHRPLALSPH